MAEAADGREAIEKARELKPDVVILDFRMPGVNGIDATRTIVKELPGTAVIVLTVHNSKALMRLALGAGGALLHSQVGSQPAVGRGRRVDDYSATDACSQQESEGLMGRRSPFGKSRTPRTQVKLPPLPAIASGRAFSLCVQAAVLASTVCMKSRIM